MSQLEKGITLGILGGGQLGRMSAMAAARLGISTIIYCPEEDSPASHVAAQTIIAAYDDHAALKKFAQSVDYITYEFENIPVETIAFLEQQKKGSVFPDQKLLDVSQDRAKEKSFLNKLGIKTAHWTAVVTINDIAAAAKTWPSGEFILKTARLGYDGKGQIRCSCTDIDKNDRLQDFLAKNKGQSFIMENIVSFTAEMSVIVSRDLNGKTEFYGPMLNEHRSHILHTTTIPSNLSARQAEEAIAMARKIADAVNLRGVLTVELFVATDSTILANEIAPRTHNSGHWTIDACAVSQFEQHVRTVCSLPVGSSARHSDAVMLNLIGDDIKDCEKYLNQPGACLHLYGKHEARPGRKMGHVTFLKPLSTV